MVYLDDVHEQHPQSLQLATAIAHTAGCRLRGVAACSGGGKSVYSARTDVMQEAEPAPQRPCWISARLVLQAVADELLQRNVNRPKTWRQRLTLRNREAQYFALLREMGGRHRWTPRASASVAARVVACTDWSRAVRPSSRGNHLALKPLPATRLWPVRLPASVWPSVVPRLAAG